VKALPGYRWGDPGGSCFDDYKEEAAKMAASPEGLTGAG